jgi:hypothetical protein
MRKAVLLPAIFAAVAVPLALFVISGAGTHMSPLLLYLPAVPWWMVYQGGSIVSETGVLLIGCTINAFLLYLLGTAWDRRISSKERASTGRVRGHRNPDNDG